MTFSKPNYPSIWGINTLKNLVFFHACKDPKTFEHVGLMLYMIYIIYTVYYIYIYIYVYNESPETWVVKPPPPPKKKWKETLRFPIMETFPQAAPTPARAPRASEILAGSAEAFRCDAKKKNGQRIWRGVQSVTIVELQFKTCLHLGEAAYSPKFLQASRSKPSKRSGKCVKSSRGY